jgi:hypothetical protein
MPEVLILVRIVSVRQQQQRRQDFERPDFLPKDDVSDGVLDLGNGLPHLDTEFPLIPPVCEVVLVTVKSEVLIKCFFTVLLLLYVPFTTEMFVSAIGH